MTLCALLSAAQQPQRSAALSTGSLEEMEVKGVKMSFDVASVKPNNSGGRFASNIGPLYPGAPYSPTGGFFSATNVNLAVLIMFAYDLDNAQFLNLFDHLPKWGTTDRFDVQAKSEANPSREQMRLMMQSLLADRFKLAVHRETKEGPIYALVLVKPGQLGPQLKPDAEALFDESSVRVNNVFSGRRRRVSAGMRRHEDDADHARPNANRWQKRDDGDFRHELVGRAWIGLWLTARAS